jgi:Ca-activated chloride channel homolog
MRFESPWLLIILLALPLIWESAERDRFFAWLRHTVRRRKGGVAFTSPMASAEFRASAQASSFRARNGGKALSIIASIGYIALVVALARPQSGSSFREVEMSGRDILLTLDLSRSMSALDFYLDGDRVDRLTALKKVVKEFIDARKGDRMGLVVFGQEVFTQCPLTSDREALKQFVDNLEVGMAGDSTSLGDGIGIALKRLTSITADSKVIVLVTDGKSNTGSVQPLSAAALAAEMKVKIHAIGIGGPEPAPIPFKDMFGFVRMEHRALEYDEKTLREIARLTGGRYFNAKDTTGLEEIYRDIDRLEERQERVFEHTDYEEAYLPFVVIGALLLLLAKALSATWYLKVA